MSEQLQHILEYMIKLDRKFTTFANAAGYEFDADGNATRVAKPMAATGGKSSAARDPVKMSEYDLSQWPSIPDEQLFDDWRRAKKRNKGSVSQSTINTIGKKLCIAGKNGFCVNDCLATAESAGWRGFEPEWMSNGDTQVKRYGFMELARGDHLPALQAKHANSAMAIGHNPMVSPEFAALEAGIRANN